MGVVSAGVGVVVLVVVVALASVFALAIVFAVAGAGAVLVVVAAAGSGSIVRSAAGCPLSAAHAPSANDTVTTLTRSIGSGPLI